MFESFRKLEDAIALAKRKSLDDNDDGSGGGDRKGSLFEVSKEVCSWLKLFFSRPKAKSIMLADSHRSLRNSSNMANCVPVVIRPTYYQFVGIAICYGIHATIFHAELCKLG